jgi:hypothetical protein
VEAFIENFAARRDFAPTHPANAETMATNALLLNLLKIILLLIVDFHA